jgi:hypothetical protein
MSVNTQSKHELHETREARDRFSEFIFNRKTSNREAALKHTKAKFKDTEPVFAPMINQKSHAIALKQAI